MRQDTRADLTADELAERAGVDSEYVGRLVEVGILRIAEGRTGFRPTDARRIQIVRSLEESGLPLDGIGAASKQGALSLDFVEQESYDRFSAYADETFEQASTRTGVPVELLLTLREAAGSGRPEPTDRLRDNELEAVPMVEVLVARGIRTTVIDQTLRAYGDSLRRIADTESTWWRTDVLAPLIRAGKTVSAAGHETAVWADVLAERTDRAMLGLLHSNQANAWMRNILEGFETGLADAGLHTRRDRQPAICFLDLTGYTRLTDERGDEAAAEVAARLTRLVESTSRRHGGRPVKWLGDGVMFHFGEPAGGVRSALEMVEGARQAELPPAHVGVHTGPVLFQEGDYFGRTVNIAARIADYARQGEVLVSQDVVDAVGDAAAVAFSMIGPVELKGIPDPITLHVAQRAG
jgi:adenylate cyclase